jgi:site-specific DNA-methyltransferase (adenine-specific)
MASLAAESVDLVFADPPFNIGFDYDGEYDDARDPIDYSEWSHNWISNAHRVLQPHGALWIAICDEWVAELKIAANTAGFHLRSWVIWYYTFGVNASKKLTRSHAHLLYMVKDPKNFIFNTDEVRQPSARTLVYKDKRANPAGRLPDDTWIIRPQELDNDAFPEFGDTWHIPRIAGSFKQRIDGAPNQMPEQLLGRIIRLCSEPGMTVLDPFAGSGTTLVTAKKLGRDYIGYELSERFAAGATKRIEAASEGDVLDGPLPQGS